MEESNFGTIERSIAAWVETCQRVEELQKHLKLFEVHLVDRCRPFMERLIKIYRIVVETNERLKSDEHGLAKMDFDSESTVGTFNGYLRLVKSAM